MSDGEDRQSSNPPLRRFKLAVQKNRVLLYTFACLVAVIFKELGIFNVSLTAIAGAWLVAASSALVLYWIASKRWTLNLDPLWYFLDSGLVTWTIHHSGGIQSPWFPWYLAVISGAAVVSGITWAVIMSVVDTVAYMALLVMRGDIQHFDALFLHTLALMISLCGASFFFLWGITQLQKKRAIIKQMKENESRKLTELTRITAALDQRTQELADANLKIRQADQMKSQFLANMSHELRTPLNSIIGFSEILITHLEGQLPERYAKFLPNIHDSGLHLLGLINNLLDLSKIEAGKMEVIPEQFLIDDVLYGITTIMRGVADKRGIRFEMDIAPDLPLLEADPVKVKQILFNLMSNAVKFSPERGAVSLVAKHLGPDDSPLGEDSIAVSVTDRGPGIELKHQEIIFEEFRQLDSAEHRSSGGTGLGLALVKRFVELHNGLVTVQSSLDAGSTFTVTLPCRFRGAPTPEGASLPFVTAPKGYQRVLVVEDDPTAYEAVTRDFAKAEFVAVRARTGEEALKLAAALSPAAITLDIILPDIDGWEVLKQLKADPKTRFIPVIIVSMLDNRELGLALGADDYFMKPIEGETFIQHLKELAPSETLEKSKLLLIDDDKKIHRLLDEWIGAPAFQLDHAYSGKEGVEMAVHDAYSLLILDLLMEEMDGFEVANVLKSKPETAELPILVFTAKELTPEDRQRLSGKVAALVQKGAAYPGDLVGIIRSLLHRHVKRAET